MRTTGCAPWLERPPVRDGATEFLFERQEQARREGERHEPQRGERRELVGAADGDGADLEEGVGGETGEQQRDADGYGALGQRCAGRRGRDDGRHDCRSLARRRPTTGAGRVGQFAPSRPQLAARPSTANPTVT